MELTTRQRLADTIRRLRTDRDLTYRQAGGLTGIDPSHIHRIEAAKYSPTIETLERLAAGYRITVTTILKRSGVR